MEDAGQYLALRGMKSSHRSVSPQTGKDPTVMGKSDGQRRLFVVTSNDKETLKMSLQNLKHYVQMHTPHQVECFMEDLAYTLNQRRSMLPWKTAVSAASAAELVESLQAPTITRLSTKVPRIGLVFTGQGAQWHGMAQELIHAFPVFESTLVEANCYLQKMGATWSIFDELDRDASTTNINIAAICQPLCTAIQIGLVNLLQSWGVQASAVVGHSSGEAAAAYAAGALTMDAALSISYFRGLLSTNISSKAPHLPGAMIAVGVSKEEAETYISTVSSGYVTVACINSPSNVTLSGDASAIEELLRQLQSKEVFARKLKSDTAYHSNHMQAIADDYLMALRDLRTNPLIRVPFWSSVTGQLVEAIDLDAKYWVRHMLSPVRFVESVRNLCLRSQQAHHQGLERRDSAIDFLIEIGPHSALASSVKQILATPELKDANIEYTSTLRRNRDNVAAILDSASAIFTAGYPLKMNAINLPRSQSLPRVLVDLPPYAWKHTVSHWYESRLSTNHRYRKHPRHDLLGAPVNDFNELEPRWRNILRVSDIPWVRDHVVQSSIVYPAAGYISMAIEAVAQCISDQDTTALGFRLRNLDISKALVIPDDSDGIETNFVLRPFNGSSSGSSTTWQEFCLYSHSKEEGWSEHCRGLIAMEGKESKSGIDTREKSQVLETNRQKFADGATACHEVIDIQGVYRLLETLQLKFGGTFKNLVDAYGGPCQALCTVAIPDTKAVMPQGFEYPHVVHPATMDAILQTFIISLMSTGTPESPMLPKSIKEIFVAADINKTAGHQFSVHASTQFKGPHETETVITVVDDSNRDKSTLVEVKKLKCVSLSGRDLKQNVERRKLCYNMSWEPDVDMLTPEMSRKLFSATSGAVDPITISILDHISLQYIADALKVLKESDYDNMQPHHQRYYKWMQLQSNLASAGKLETLNLLEAARDSVNVDKLRNELQGSPDGRLLDKVGSNLVRILTNQAQPLDLMMENDLLHELYSNGIGVDRSSAQLASYVDKISHKLPNMNILEIGAGTGGSTLPMLLALGGHDNRDARFSHYAFTDISSGFFEKARAKFNAWSGLMSFKKLNIECDPEEQGFQKQEFDLILAANVVHATRSLDNTMQNIRSLLKPNGKLIMVEITHPAVRVSLIFGTLPGWWLGETSDAATEESREMAPTLAESQWEAVLKKNGFSGLDACLWDQPKRKDHLASLIVSTALSAVEDKYPEVTLIHDGSLESTFLDLLQGSLAKVVGVPPTLNSLENAQVDGKACIFLIELNRPILSCLSSAQFNAIKRSITTAQAVLWVSRGGRTPSSEMPEASLVSGLFCALRCEFKLSKLVTLDLDPQTPHDETTDIESIIGVFRSAFSLESDKTECDNEFCVRDKLISIPRVLENHQMNDYISARAAPKRSAQQAFSQTSRFLHLEIEIPGLLDSFIFVDNPAFALPLGDDEVEIEIKACGLNFHDVLTAMGHIESGPLGYECGGIVRSIGNHVKSVGVGERVFAWVIGAFGNYVRTNKKLVQRIPREMTYEEAASVPAVYSTAYISLCETARLRKGETVLIHAAAGGVGQAAIALAQWIGAEVFATVSTVEKRQFIMERYHIAEDHIFSSRDTTFASGVMRLTENKGVNVILNSLSGDGLRESWNCISMFGRFVEIGKRDLFSNSLLEMEPFLRHVSFSAIDLDTILYHKSDYAAEILAKIMELLEKKVIEPVQPITVFSMSEVEAAFRLMQGGKHIGKIVIAPQPGDQVKASVRVLTNSVFRDDVSYLLVGGLGGLGKAIAQWMVWNGAKNIVFLSRNGSNSHGSQEFVKDLEKDGATVTSHTGNVCDEKLDISFEKMTLDDYESVLLPKVGGSWNLHRCLLRTDLDFFVILGSAVGVVGNPGQSNYAAASAFQDALSCHRVSMGLPSVTIDLGVVQGAGYVFENDQTKAKLKRQLYDEIDIEELRAILQFVVTQSSENQSSQVITGLHISEDLVLDSEEFGKDRRKPLWTQDPKFSHLRSVSVMRIRDNNDLAKVLLYRLQKAQTLEEGSLILQEAVIDKLSRLLMIPKDNISPNHTTAALGVDSLIGVELRNWVLHEIKADIPLFEILGKGSIATLSHRIATKSELLGPAVRITSDRKSRSADPLSDGRREVTENAIPRDNQNGTKGLKEPHRVRKMRALFEQYSRGLQPARHPPVEDENWTVMLIGSTGSAGSYLLERLLQHPNVIKIICINRSINSRERQIEANALRGLPTNFTLDRVEFVQAKLGAHDLGLAPETYRSLLSSVTHVVHAAWKLDFISPVEAFEHDHLCGVRNVIQFSISSSKTPRIYFLSSLSSVIDWQRHHPGFIPEEIIDDHNAAVPLGYAESKLVAEQLLSVASKRCGVLTYVIRAGQLTGPVHRKGMWNRTEWFPSIIASGRYLGLLPETMKGADTIDWVPVDIFAQIVMELMDGAEITSPPLPTVYNVVNPRSAQWSVLLPAIIAYLNRKGVSVQTVPFDTWINALKKSTTSGTQGSASQNPASYFLELFRVLGERKEAVTPEMRRALAASNSLASMEPVQEEWVMKWMQEWEMH
ncbi:Lovastatin diketide synthase LovF [Penicillium subrubescens]|uniref:Lovastatin diketide synthase LovF n=1 Tax=Penicillium subrubescens TaxID=1316194 RepID=A0A1Q5UCX3_9EURO|nr:Lovastatin diketide synthase LovF [Penicillium subrubescens]